MPVRYKSHNIRPLWPLLEALRADPVAKVNQGSLVKLLLNQFCAAELKPVKTSTLALALEGKTADSTTSIHITAAELRHFKRYMKRFGVSSFGSLVQSALAHRYFPEAYACAAQSS